MTQRGSVVTGIREGMPLLARHEGVWHGTYTYVDAAGKVIDSHKSVLHCMLRDDDTETPYFQTNDYEWDDGRTEHHEFPAKYADGQILFDTERMTGHAWEVDDHCIVLTWVYKADPSVSLYELIYLDDTGTRKSRTWHWLKDGVCFQRTLIDEQRAG